MNELAHLVCRLGGACRLCRDKSLGRRWRRRWAKRIGVDLKGAPDFECPWGKPWAEMFTKITVRNEPIPETEPCMKVKNFHAIWHDIHALAFRENWRDVAREVINGVSARLKSCQNSCQKNWDAYLASHPPDYSSADALWLWGYLAHCDVQRRQKITPPPLEEMLERWRAEARGCLQ